MIQYPTKKVKHLSKKRALAALRRGVNGCGVGLNVYFCDKCKGWHVGKSNNRTKRRLHIEALLDKVNRE